MRKLLIIGVFLLFVFTILQAKEIDTLAIVKVESQEFYGILDKIIEHEKKCDYYSSDLIFEILLRRVGGILDIQIQAGGKKKYKIGYEKGLFQHEGHLFFVCGIFDESIFSYTEYKTTYAFEKIKDVIDPITGETIITIYEDDSYTNWIYQYENNKFILEGIYETSCCD